ncbi:Uu.00g042560.m01.CDS01 [Anthostomella pinea]|uniref:Uu.00g042560.m01.CDS01 n=1 Tax=Anthostomella pinea TaxID=933095 RepID=A0AAI8VAQ4_9PEZI|nr:Uu.00g042560.m01.CDS01 [Anthostomella pinea]
MAALAILAKELLLTVAETTILEQHDLWALAVVSRRFHHVFDPLLYTLNKDDRRSDAVHWAAYRGRIDILEKAHSHGLDLGLSGVYSRMYWACRSGNTAIVQWLLDHGVPVDGPREKRRLENVADSMLSALCFALMGKHQATMILLISRGACLRVLTRVGVGMGRHFLHLAAKEGLDAVVEYRITTTGIPANLQCESTRGTPLHFAVMEEGTEKIIRTLLSLGADMVTSQELPLTVAIRYRRFENATTLLEAGSPVSPTSAQVHGLPPMNACARLGGHYSAGSEDWVGEKDKLLRKLIAVGADVEASYQGVTPLGEAVARGTASAVYELVRAGGASSVFDFEADLERLEKLLDDVLPDTQIDYVNLTRTCNRLLANIGVKIESRLKIKHSDTSCGKNGYLMRLAMVEVLLRENAQHASSKNQTKSTVSGKQDGPQLGPQMEVAAEVLERYLLSVKTASP